MKKLFALILAVLMVASLVACAPAAPQTTTAPKATQPAGTQPAGTTAPAATTEAPFDPEASPWVEPGSVKLVVGLSQNATVLDYEDNYVTKYLEEKTGIDIEFMFFSSNATEATQQLNLMVAGKEKLPDLMLGFLNQALIRELGKEGVLLDLAPYFEQGLNYYSKRCYDIATPDLTALLWSTATADDGGIYGFPSIGGTGTIDSLVFAGYINKTFAENVGMNADDIDTVDELYQYLKAVVNNDGNKNGTKDEIGLLGCMKNNMNKVELQVINAYVQFQEKFIYNVTDGEVWSPLNTDEYRKALITLNKWYEEGLISPLSYSLQSHPEMKAMIENKDGYTVAVWYGHPTTIISAETEIAKDYQAMPPLKDETGKGGYGLRIETTKVDMKCAISATCEYPELAFRFIDLLTDKYTERVTRYGQQGVHWDLLDPAESEKLGRFTQAGLPADTIIIKDEWSEETKATWHTGIIAAEVPGRYPYGLSYAGVEYKDPGFNRNKLSRDVYNLCVAVGEPEETLKALAYDAEEQAVVDQYEKGLKAFFKEARAEFVTGVRDPNSDADWAAYLKELELNGHSELMEAKQTAYDRMMEFAK